MKDGLGVCSSVGMGNMSNGIHGQVSGGELARVGTSTPRRQGDAHKGGVGGAVTCAAR